MYALLLSLGAVIAAAGFALAATGISLQDRAFDAAAAMPGIVSIIGGCILIGLGFVVRALSRVERALNARAVARAAPPSDASAESSTDHAAEPRIAFPAKANTPGAASAEPTSAEKSSSEAPPEHNSPAERIETSPVVEAADVSLLPKEPVRADEDHGVAHAGLANGKLNGASHTTTAPRLAGGPARRPQPKNSIFDALWPKASAASAAPAAQTAAAAGAVNAAPPPVEPSPAVAAGPEQTAAAVSILKSGVVEGMAYTLYSDGSIEAQLPGGTVRFASITELRSHIEQNG
jgi:hypothetical protein